MTTEETLQKTNVSMRGGGYYDANSSTQGAIIATSESLIRKSLESIPPPEPNKPFIFVDFGCSEGANSISVACTVIDAVKQLRPYQKFMVVHNDLPSNNFNRLFSHIPVEYNKHYQRDEVFAFASGASFFGRVMPDDTTHFGFSSSSVHWLSNLPPRAIREDIYCAAASAGERETLGRIAHADWTAFLKSRAAELVPGGRMLVVMGAALNYKNDYGEMFSCQKLMALLDDLLRDSVNDGDIYHDFYEQFCIPLYMRSEKEIMAPFKNNVEGIGVALDVESCKIEAMPCPFQKKYKDDKDARAYAESVVGTLRAFCEPVLLAGLFGTSERRRSERSSSKPQQALDKVFSRMKDRIESEPTEFTFNPITAYVMINKK